MTHSLGPASKAWLETAHSIGRRIAGQAFWHEDRCNWIGASLKTGANGQAALAYVTLGPDLYDGTSGIAVFLAELGAATGDTDIRRTAMGAMRHALSRAGDLPPSRSVGLYSGRIGIALAAARVGRLLACDEFVEGGRGLARPLGDAGDEFDLIAGRAGAIVGLITLCELLDEPGLMDSACQLGEALVRTAIKENGGWSWSSAKRAKSRNLAGLSHGASGPGYALHELSAAVGNPVFFDAAEAAFRYERGLFDSKARNWPDLRDTGAGSSRSASRQFATYWCHGAPGIALARLRAYELTGQDTHHKEAIVGVETTRRFVEAVVMGGVGNYSLCHGLAGNAEVLLYGQAVLGADWMACRRVALGVAEAGIERFARRGIIWPCGTRGGETPGLMLGLAGIGMFYLRLGDPEIPSALHIRTWSQTSFSHLDGVG
jgi:lantibiotic biosynthesis protein